MKIVLIWPKGYDINYVMPISLGYLKSNIDDKHEVMILDCALKNIDSDSKELKNFVKHFSPDIVGVSSWSNVYLEALSILKTIKLIDEKIITVIGGAHATVYSSNIIVEKAIDFVFKGEAEYSFSKFINTIDGKNKDFSKIPGLVYLSSKGNIIQNEMYREKYLNTIKIPDYTAINLKEYIRRGYRFNTIHKLNAPVWVTRGCPYACSFCSASLLNGRLVRKHSVDYMIKWIKDLYYKRGIKHISIIDDNFTFDIDYAKSFCKRVIGMNLKGLTFGTPNGIRIERIDPELLKLMKKAKWENIVVAPESGSIKTLKKMKKNISPDVVLKKIKEIKQVGFKIHGFFMMGYPGETKEDIKQTLRLLRSTKLNFFFLNNFQPLPGTLVYDKLVLAGEIQEGLLPSNYSNGERSYTPDSLKNFNFPFVILREYVYLAITNPLNIPYMFRIINPFIIIKKVCSNMKNMFLKSS